MSGREVFEGNHERMGANVIENAKLAQPPPPRAGPNPKVASTAARVTAKGRLPAQVARLPAPSREPTCQPRPEQVRPGCQVASSKSHQ
eukprot:1816378-Prymnesium_polylepis.1